MLEEIKYYDVESLRGYIENWIVPLVELSNIVGKYFKGIDNDLARYAKEIYNLSKKIVELAEERLKFKPKLENLHEPRNIYEVIEYGRLFLEKAYNLTIVSNPYTFFIWSIRKITKSYLEAHYPKLIEEGEFNEVVKILGLEEYWKPPKLEPRKIVEDYTLYAYLDFETEEKSPKDTIGGLISKLNEKILFELSSSNIRAYGTLYEKTSLLEKYKDMVGKILETTGWKKHAEVNNLFWVPEVSAYSATRYVASHRRPHAGDVLVFIIEGIIVEYSNKRIALFKFLDEIMPLQMLGVVELRIGKISQEKKKIKVKFRIGL